MIPIQELFSFALSLLLVFLLVNIIKKRLSLKELAITYFLSAAILYVFGHIFFFVILALSFGSLNGAVFEPDYRLSYAIFGILLFICFYLIFRGKFRVTILESILLSILSISMGYVILETSRIRRNASPHDRPIEIIDYSDKTMTIPSTTVDTPVKAP